MTFPLWAVFGLAASLCSAFFPLVQEKVKAPPLVMAYWIKIATLAFSLPWMLAVGVPADPIFYLLVFISALLYCISDIFYFRAVAEEGAGVVARLIPASVIGSFFLWFAVDPTLVDKYLARPWITAGILVVILLSIACIMRLRRCPVSSRAARTMWFVLLMATLGPVLAKFTFRYADPAVGPVAHLCVQAGMMLAIWTVYALIRRPVPMAAFRAGKVWQAGLVAGVLSGLAVALKNYGFASADNPAYPAVLLYLDSLWVLLIYKLVGRPATGDLKAGLGLVFCAAALVLLKSL